MEREVARDFDLLAAGVDIAGVHLWGNSIGPESVSYQSSSISVIENRTSPVLLVHGDDDRNDHRAGAASPGARRPHELIVFPNDVHDFRLHERWLTIFKRDGPLLRPLSDGRRGGGDGGDTPVTDVLRAEQAGGGLRITAAGSSVS